MSVNDCTSEEKAARVGFYIGKHGSITRAMVMRITLLRPEGATTLLRRISRVIPIWYDRTMKQWRICE